MTLRVTGPKAGVVGRRPVIQVSGALKWQHSRPVCWKLTIRPILDKTTTCSPQE